MGALERTIRDFAENPSDKVVQPTLGMSFDSLNEAYDYYNLYSWEHGFGIRFGKSRLNAQRTKCMQEIVCGCAVRRTVLFFGLGLPFLVICVCDVSISNSLRSGFVKNRGSLVPRTHGLAGVNALPL
jgi:hypothetical protein